MLSGVGICVVAWGTVSVLEDGLGRMVKKKVRHSRIRAGHRQEPPGLCPGFFLGGSGQLAPEESVQVDEHTQM